MGVEGFDPFVLGRKVYNHIAIRILGILAALFRFSVHPP
ncbi:photosystem ii cp47 reaction center protein [Quercus suber]|uniref:Photosystem ii cp47 reaction center protein n=1 Tax=Quercus suber TaxID=58331 RepID=A0AAW0ITT9_QUESU